MRLGLATQGYSACQKCYHMRLLVHQSRGLHRTPVDMVKEVRSLKHTHVCSEERTVVRCAVLMWMEVRAQRTNLCIARQLQVPGCHVAR